MSKLPMADNGYPQDHPYEWDRAGIPTSAYDEADLAKAGLHHGHDKEPIRKAQQAVRQGLEAGKLSYPSTSESLAQVNLATAESRGLDMVNLPPHYARFKIEPIRFIAENKLDWFQGNIIKYVCRHDAKNGMEDIRKTIRYANMYLLYLAGDPDWWKAGKPEDFRANEGGKP